ncbi:MAG: PIN domain-containing protein [Fimbriimonadales bacterium]
MRSGSGDLRPAMADSNIFVYSHDLSAGEKREVAKKLLRTLSDEGRLVVTVQIVHEFCAVMMRKRRQGLVQFDSVRELAEELMATATVLPLTSSITRRALYGVERYQLAFWDALIWAAAREYGIPTLYTEDFTPGATLEGVAIINPFASDA